MQECKSRLYNSLTKLIFNHMYHTIHIRNLFETIYVNYINQQYVGCHQISNYSLQFVNLSKTLRCFCQQKTMRQFRLCHSSYLPVL